MNETAKTAGLPGNLFVRLTMFAAKTPFWGGAVLTAVMFAPGVAAGALASLAASSYLSFGETGQWTWTFLDPSAVLYPEHPRAAVLWSLPGAAAAALVIEAWARWFRANGANPKILHMPYAWFARLLLILTLVGGAAAMVAPEAVADFMFADDAEAAP